MVTRVLVTWPLPSWGMQTSRDGVIRFLTV